MKSLKTCSMEDFAELDHKSLLERLVKYTNNYLIAMKAGGKGDELIESKEIVDRLTAEIWRRKQSSEMTVNGR